MVAVSALAVLLARTFYQSLAERLPASLHANMYTVTVLPTEILR